MHPALILPLFKGVCSFLPHSVPWDLLTPLQISGTKMMGWWWKFSRSRCTLLLQTFTRTLSLVGSGERELSCVGGCTALLKEAEMDDLNGGLALQNQKRFYKQSCMNHK